MGSSAVSRFLRSATSTVPWADGRASRLLSTTFPAEGRSLAQRVQHLAQRHQRNPICTGERF